MKTLLPALALMLSAAYFTGCDSNDGGDLEALQAQIDDQDDDSLIEALQAPSDEEDDESASPLETAMDLTDHGRPSSSMKTCKQWLPTPGMCENADNACQEPGEWACEILTQCIKCNVDWSGGV